jgi:hypothetical protein
MPIPAAVAPLIAQGMSLLGNAVMAKGSDWLKEKTGVDIESGTLSSEDRRLLKQFEMEHEEELLKIQQEDDRIQLEYERALLLDKASAREMQGEALKQSDVFSKRFVYVFAIVWSLFAGAYIVAITFMDIPPENVRFADTILGFVLGTIIANIVNFFYGSSRSSQVKDILLSEMRNKK